MDLISSLVDPVAGVIQGVWRSFLDLIEDTAIRDSAGELGRVVDNIEGSLGIDADEDISNGIQGRLGSSESSAE